MKTILTTLLFFGLCLPSFAKKNNFFEEAKILFEEEKYEESKFLFQRNIVYNPKNAESYLYLAKIFDFEENKVEQEKYINSTLLLEPKNEEAMYLLIDIELKRSNFSKVEELNENFEKICSNMCEKLTLIKSRLKELE
jgi:tetratricopeptide (TPR) repeat protein|tara:strand:- start:933 stop:1346 length:414 start_codon:yes stop_codon:yes gene_type:complete